VRAWRDDGAKRPGQSGAGPGVVGHEDAGNEPAGETDPPKSEGTGGGNGAAIETYPLVSGAVFAPSEPDDGPRQRTRDTSDGRAAAGRRSSPDKDEELALRTEPDRYRLTLLALQAELQRITSDPLQRTFDAGIHPAGGSGRTDPHTLANAEWWGRLALHGGGNKTQGEDTNEVSHDGLH